MRGIMLIADFVDRKESFNRRQQRKRRFFEVVRRAVTWPDAHLQEVGLVIAGAA
jgi:hypothetical protein